MLYNERVIKQCIWIGEYFVRKDFGSYVKTNSIKFRIFLHNYFRKFYLRLISESRFIPKPKPQMRTSPDFKIWLIFRALAYWKLVLNTILYCIYMLIKKEGVDTNWRRDIKTTSVLMDWAKWKIDSDLFSKADFSTYGRRQVVAVWEYWSIARDSESEHCHHCSIDPAS